MPYPKNLERTVGQSAADTAKTTSTPSGAPRRISHVTVKYSAPVTVNVTNTLNSGAGDAYDVLLPTIVITADVDGVWFPDKELIINDDDVLDVLAPAGGAGITSAVTIYSEAL